MMHTGQSPIPIERTLLTTGVLDKAMHSRWKGHVLVETPDLDIVYQAPERVEDTGVGHPLPQRTTDLVWSFGNADRDKHRNN